jgi:3-phenylpropionate/trans-cinnamate dioxygenase ferredoxin subunit
MMTDLTYTAVTKKENITEKSFACFDVEGTAVVVCRFKDEYFAIENRCSHALSTFEDGRMRGYRMMCPLHGAAFDIRDGSALSLPAKQPIRSFPLRTVDGMIEIDLKLAD